SRSPSRKRLRAAVSASSASSRASVRSVVPLGTGSPCARKVAAFPRCRSATISEREAVSSSARCGNNRNSREAATIAADPVDGLAGCGIALVDIARFYAQRERDEFGPGAARDHDRAEPLSRSDSQQVADGVHGGVLGTERG